MHLDDISKALLIRNNVNAIIKYKIFIINYKFGHRLDVILFIQMTHGILGLTQAHLSFTQINATRFHFIGIVELIM